MITFRLRPFFFALGLFIIEVLIALFVHDHFIRPYVGDYLVVILLYCAAKSFLNISPLKLALGALLFAYCIEFLQYVKFIEWLGLSHNQFAKTVIGYGFEWLDLLAYTLGIATVLAVENLSRN